MSINFKLTIMKKIICCLFILLVMMVSACSDKSDFSEIQGQWYCNDYVELHKLIDAEIDDKELLTGTYDYVLTINQSDFTLNANIKFNVADISDTTQVIKGALQSTESRILFYSDESIKLLGEFSCTGTLDNNNNLNLQWSKTDKSNLVFTRKP